MCSDKLTTKSDWKFKLNFFTRATYNNLHKATCELLLRDGQKNYKDVINEMSHSMALKKGDIKKDSYWK